MGVSVCSERPILQACSLEGFEYQIDPYIGCEHYCRYCYVLNQAESDWTEEILLHGDIADQLTRELGPIHPQTIYMGYHSDPYQQCEAHCVQTRKALQLLLRKGCTASILTKSNLVVRDADVLREMDTASVGVSVAFDDNRVRRLFERNTIDTELRIGALRTLKEAGVKTTALICPVIPYLTDVVQLLESLIPHVESIWVYGLSIEDRSHENWRNVREILSSHFGEKKQKIEEAIFTPDHPYWTELRECLQEIRIHRQLDVRIHV